MKLLFYIVVGLLVIAVVVTTTIRARNAPSGRRLDEAMWRTLRGLACVGTLLVVRRIDSSIPLLLLALATFVLLITALELLQSAVLRRQLTKGKRTALPGYAVVPRGKVFMRMSGSTADLRDAAVGSEGGLRLQTFNQGQEYEVTTDKRVAQEHMLEPNETTDPLLARHGMSVTCRWYRVRNHNGRARVSHGNRRRIPAHI